MKRLKWRRRREGGGRLGSRLSCITKHEKEYKERTTTPSIQHSSFSFYAIQVEKPFLTQNFPFYSFSSTFRLTFIG